MSGYQPSAHPAPPVFGDADYRDDDIYGLDCRAAMASRGDSIASAALVGIARVDGAALQSGDLEITGVAVVAAGATIYLPGAPVVALAGMFVSWRGQQGLAGSGYRVTLALTLASGVVINRTVVINVPPFVG